MPHFNMLHLKALILATAMLGAQSGTASAKALRNEAAIDNSMLRVALAIEISNECPSIAARKLKGLNYLWTLKAKASELGYSDTEIRTYVESKAEKARIRARGEAYVKAAGYDPKSAHDLCALGKKEIAQKSLIGSFLRSKI